MSALETGIHAGVGQNADGKNFKNPPLMRAIFIIGLPLLYAWRLSQVSHPP